MGMVMRHMYLAKIKSNWELNNPGEEMTWAHEGQALKLKSARDVDKWSVVTFIK